MKKQFSCNCVVRFQYPVVSTQESLVAVEPRRPPKTNKGTETAFRHDQCNHFQKSKRLLRSEVSWCDQTRVHFRLYRSTTLAKKTATTIMHKIRTLFLSRKITRLPRWCCLPRLRAPKRNQAWFFDIPWSEQCSDFMHNRSGRFFFLARVVHAQRHGFRPKRNHFRGQSSRWR